jgi:hypothetical protein
VAWRASLLCLWRRAFSKLSRLQHACGSTQGLPTQLGTPGRTSPRGGACHVCQSQLVSYKCRAGVSTRLAFSALEPTLLLVPLTLFHVITHISQLQGSRHHSPSGGSRPKANGPT